MRLTLPSGGWFEFRDTLMRGDIREARRGMKFVTGPDGSRVVDGAFLDDLRGRLAVQMMVGWSFGPPSPKDCIGEHLQQQRLDQMLDDADSLALDIFLQPWANRIVNDPASARQKLLHIATGIVLPVPDPLEAQRLIESGQFAPPEDGDAPKALPSSTATSSAASPEPSGQEQTTAPML